MQSGVIGIVKFNWQLCLRVDWITTEKFEVEAKAVAIEEAI